MARNRVLRAGAARRAARKGGKQTTTKQIKNIKTQIKKLKNSEEVKYCEVANGAATSTYTGNVAVLSNPTQGTLDFNNRIGDSCRLKSLHIKGTVLGDGAATGYVNYQRIRFVVFRGKEENSVTPSVSDVLSSTYVGTNSALLAPRNWDTMDKWTVYYDRIHTVGAGFNYPTTGLYQSGINTTKDFNIFIPLHNAVFNQVAATTAIAHGGIYLIGIGENTANVNYKFVSRLTYSDA